MIPNNQIFGSSSGIFLSPDSTFVSEPARTPNEPYSYTGSVVTCGTGGTHATLTAAYAACSSGDIIQIMSGSTLITNNEAGGYWLISGAKDVLVRGNPLDNTSCTIEQNAAASFGVRIHQNSGIVFKDLTIKTDQNTYLIYCDGDEANRNIIFDNCRMLQNGSGANSVFLNITGIDDIQTRYFEFKGCYFDKLLSTSIPFNLELPSPNNTFLFTDCEFNIDLSSAIRCHNTFDGNIIMYDCVFTQKSSDPCVQFGNDTIIPVATITEVDFRGNIITFDPGAGSHGILLGRGTDVVKCYNNQIYITESDPLSIGIVVKTTSTNVGDSIISGNFCYACRPFYIKGGSKVTTVHNSFITSHDDYETFGFSNHKDGADEVLSRFNVFTYNSLLGLLNSIRVYDTGAAEADDVSIKTGTFDNNRYSAPGYSYLYDEVNDVQYSFSNRSAFWVSSNEANSISINAKYNY